MRKQILPFVKELLNYFIVFILATVLIVLGSLALSGLPID